MSFTSSNLTRIVLREMAFPETVKQISFEDELAQMQADLLADFPAVADVINLETEPLVILLQRLAAEKVRLLGLLNDEARNNTLAHAFGSSLDNFAAFWGITRHVVNPGDPSAIPPVPPTLEADDVFRDRIQLASEGLTVAGSPGSYKSHGFAASPDVKDIGIKRGQPGEAVMSVLARTGNGTASAALLNVVRPYVLERIPLCTDLIVVSTTVTEYTINAELTFLPAYNQPEVLARAKAAAQAYADGQHKDGYDVTRAGVYHALFQPGVQNINLTSPAADIVRTTGQAAFCTDVQVTAGGEDV